jgi:hypothetical protein
MATKKTPKARTPDPSQTDDEENTSGDGDEGDADIDAKINAAITNRLKAFEKRVEKTLADTLAKMVPAPKADDEDDEGDEAGETAAAPKATPAENRRLSKLEKELKREREAREKAEADAKETESKRRSAEEDTALEAALREHGIVNPVQLRAAKALIKAEGRLVRDESDQIRLNAKDKYGGDVQYDLETGVKGWVASEEGKTFLPPRGVGGSGTGGASAAGARGSNSGKRYKDLSKVEQDRIELERAFSGLPSLQPDDLV